MRCFFGVLPSGASREERCLRRRICALLRLACKLGIPCAVLGSARLSYAPPCSSLSEATVPSGPLSPCAFGLPWNQPLLIWASRLDVSGLCKSCPGCSLHQRCSAIASFEITSARAFAEPFARSVVQALLRPTSVPQDPRPGLESVLCE